jgi:hypothetical protein
LGNLFAIDFIAGTTLFISSSAGINSLPGLVLCPPMSIIPAPSFSIFSASVTISSTPLNLLPPKNESGVALMIPITIGLSITNNLPLQFNVNIRFLFVIFGDKDREKAIDNSQTMSATDKQYDEVIRSCKEIFLRKAMDYGTAWRVLRTISIVDQIFIKAQRIRTIQETGKQKVADDISAEFKGIINYAVIGLFQLDLTEKDPEEMPVERISPMFDEKVGIAKRLMQDKNHDYGEAWRSMSQESFVDLILMKLQRIRQILINEGKTIISEGIDANYLDIVNYAVFALILMSEEKV